MYCTVQLAAALATLYSSSRAFNSSDHSNGRGCMGSRTDAPSPFKILDPPLGKGHAVSTASLQQSPMLFFRCRLMLRMQQRKVVSVRLQNQSDISFMHIHCQGSIQGSIQWGRCGEASPPKTPASLPKDFVTAPQLTNFCVTIPFLPTP